MWPFPYFIRLVLLWWNWQFMPILITLTTWTVYQQGQQDQGLHCLLSAEISFHIFRMFSHFYGHYYCIFLLLIVRLPKIYMWSSEADPGTLYQLRNLIGRLDVKGQVDIISAYRSEPMINIKIYLGKCDLYFMVQWCFPYNAKVFGWRNVIPGL